LNSGVSFQSGDFIVDFCCRARKLVIELDGGQYAHRLALPETRKELLS
jgi:very-short-patch-repair endonuclease